MFYGLAVFFLLACRWSMAACDVEPGQMQGSAWQAAAVKRVLDGDTLELASGERVRMIGINAPETAKYGKPGDPLGREAWRRLQALAQPGSTLYFHRDRTPRDHYGRRLLHPFDAEGHNITTTLLAEGWGFHVVIPPNSWQAACYRGVEQQAIAEKRGVWGLTHYQPIDAKDLMRLHGGYSRVSGKVEAVILTRASAWVELAGQVSIKVAKADLKHVDGEVWQRLLEAAQQGAGQQEAGQPKALERLPALEVHGWMSDRRDWGADMRKQIEIGARKVFQFKVRHRYDWRLLDAIHSD